MLQKNFHPKKMFNSTNDSIQLDQIHTQIRMCQWEYSPSVWKLRNHLHAPCFVHSDAAEVVNFKQKPHFHPVLWCVWNINYENCFWRQQVSSVRYQQSKMQPTCCATIPKYYFRRISHNSLPCKHCQDFQETTFALLDAEHSGTMPRKIVLKLNVYWVSFAGE